MTSLYLPKKLKNTSTSIYVFFSLLYIYFLFDRKKKFQWSLKIYIYICVDHNSYVLKQNLKFSGELQQEILYVFFDRIRIYMGLIK